MPLDYPPPQVVYEYVTEAKKADCDLSFLIPLSAIAKEQRKTMKASELDDNWRLNDFFGSIVVISLPQAHERRTKMTQELYDIGVTTFEVFDAIDGRKDVPAEIWGKFYLNLHSIDDGTSKGKKAVDQLHKSQAGCYMSHLSVLKKVKKAFDAAIQGLQKAKAQKDPEACRYYEGQVQKYSRVLILEDDGGFGFLAPDLQSASKKGAGVVLRKALSKLPDDWDLLYFICNPTEPTKKVAQNLQKIGNSWSLIAYAINHLMYDDLLECLQKIEDPNITKIKPVDTEIGKLHSAHKAYAVNPALAYTQAGKSFITGLTWDAWQIQPIFPIE